MRPLLRSVLTPIIAGAILLAGVSFAVATGHQTVPKAPDKVYPCIPDHTGGHGGDYGHWKVWWQWLKQKYGEKWAYEVQKKYGASLDKYLQDKYAGKTTTTYFGGSGGGSHGDDDDDGGHHGDDDDDGGHHGDDDDDGGHHDDCKPECPDGKPGGKTMSTSTYGGSHGDDDDDGGHHGDDDDDGGGHGDDECKPPCPDKASVYTTSGGSHGGGPKPDPCPDPCKSSMSSRTSSYGGGSSHSNKCDPPDVYTGGCNTCKPNSMIVTGTVDPNGSATQYKFEYGTTPAFGWETDWESAGDGTTAKSVSEKIDGLAAGTKIYYRLVAKNKNGTENGSTRYCNTGAASKPGAVTGGTSDKKPTSATILGTVDPNGASTTAYFQWGKTSSLGSTTGSQNVGGGDDSKSVSAGLTGLIPGQTYYYRVVASNSKGTAYGDIKSFTAPADKPKCVTGGYGSLSKSGAKVNGTVNPGGGATSYYFEYGKSSSYGSKSGSASAGSGRSDMSASATVSGLSSNTKYYYRVVAVNSEGTTYGAQQSFTTSR